MKTTESIKQKCINAGQQHIADWIDSLSQDPENQNSLVNQLSNVDIDGIVAEFKRALDAEKAPANLSATIRPPESCPISDLSAEEIKRIRASKAVVPLIRRHQLGDTARSRIFTAGLEMIREQKLACVILAGGQGTRLGFSGPKGSFVVGLSQRPIFQRFAERILRLRVLAVEGTSKPLPSLPLYVMCSDLNFEATVSYWKEHSFFGLPECDCIFFQQSMAPCLTMDGKFILSSKGSLATNPNGNGGVFQSLQVTGNIADMDRRGVEGVHVIGVDNILARIGDPEFVGLCSLMGFVGGNKCCSKRSPDEPVGVMCEKVFVDGKVAPCVVEYTELNKTQASARVDPNDENSTLQFSAANICNHYFRLDFLKSFIPRFTYHIARKKVPYLDVATGAQVEPEKPNAIKLEYFIFDVFGGAPEVCAYEVDRADDFAPIKNVSGVDSPESAVQMYSDMCKRWMREAGATFENEDGLLEIAPLRSYRGENLEEFAGKNVHLPLFISQ